MCKKLSDFKSFSEVSTSGADYLSASRLENDICSEPLIGFSPPRLTSRW